MEPRVGDHYWIIAPYHKNDKWPCEPWLAEVTDLNEDDITLTWVLDDGTLCDDPNECATITDISQLFSKREEALDAYIAALKDAWEVADRRKEAARKKYFGWESARQNGRMTPYEN